MDVPPCNSLLDLWFVMLVLSKTLNGSSEYDKTNEELKGRRFFAGLFLFSSGKEKALHSPGLAIYNCGDWVVAKRTPKTRR
jgi:hypothetical protein